jgi:hypothetical protein
MRLRHLTTSVVLATSASGALFTAGLLTASPAAASDVPPGTCVYEVREADDYVPVRQGPGEWFPRLDKLGPYDRTIGACRRYGEDGRWRNVLGLYKTRIGFTEGYLLKKLGTAEQFGL